jgi:hypothetical protein
VVVGKGERLFDSGKVPAALRLADSAVFPNGTLKLDFATAGKPTRVGQAIWRGRLARGISLRDRTCFLLHGR